MKTLIVLLSGILFSVYCMAQSVSPQVVATAGNYSENGGISISWTLGEPVIETAVATDVTLTQGFQQPDYNVVLVEHVSSPELDVNVFPNPTTGMLNIQWTGSTDANATIQLFDISGKQIINQQVVTGNSTGTVNISELANATYILKIVAKDLTFSKEYRIVKE
jgi:hypothetical protein